MNPIGMQIALASPTIATSIDDGLHKVERMIAEASARGAAIVCFPETYLPGLRGQDFDVPPFDARDEERVLRTVAHSSRDHNIATILGMERSTSGGLENVAVVFNADGTVQGAQTKNQLDPSEDPHYVPGSARRLFEVRGLEFGVVICHEGWRYPETVRWAAVRGASIVFHPQLTGSDKSGPQLKEWGDPHGPYYEKAMMMRSRENTIYFASVNYATRFQESATSVIGPDGECEAFLPYGHEGVLVHEIDPRRATGLLARRFAPDRLREA